MATGTDDQMWQSFLDQHSSIVTLLDTHTTFLTRLQDDLADSGPTFELVKQRLETTGALLASLKASADSLKDTAQRKNAKTNETRPIPLIPSLKRPQPAQPIVDPSGLFTVDPNPTPVEQLLREKTNDTATSKSIPKRKATDEDPQLNDSDELPDGGRKWKRARTIGDPPVPAQAEDSEVDDSFIQEVDARSRAKEERKKERLVKKRKRHSGSSINSGPQNKKQKKKHNAKSAGNSAPESRQNRKSKRAAVPPSRSGSQKGQQHKKRKKSR